MRQKDILLLITDKCSLNCFACGYGCEDVSNNWFISKEQLITTLNQIKNTHIDGATKYSINLTGGDALLHEDWKEFAMITREILPEWTCYIATSGPLLNKIDDNILIECYNKNIRFGITLYPSMSLLPMYKSIEEKFQRLGISNCLTWNSIKIIFGKPRLNTEKDIDDCFNTLFPEIDCCFIYHDNLYNCQNLFYQDVKDKTLTNSSYNIFNIPESRNLKNKNTCKDCKNCMHSHENILWHFNSQVPKKYLFTPLKELFLYDYKYYYLLQHDCKEHLECLQNDFFKKYIIEERLHPIAKTRFISGKMDIFIPFNNYIDEKFVNLLKAQNNLDEFNIYFISYTNDSNINSKVYDDFYHPDKNIFFLKANNYLNAIHIFLYNSYLQQKYCLDINDFNFLEDSNFLKKIKEK